MNVVNHESAGFVLFSRIGYKEKFLLLKYPQGHWDLVKGHKDPGETNLQAAIRELQEETGIKDIEIKKGFSATINYSYTERKIKHQKTVVFFLAESFESDVKLSYEHLDYSWFSYDEAYKKITFDYGSLPQM